MKYHWMLSRPIRLAPLAMKVVAGTSCPVTIGRFFVIGAMLVACVSNSQSKSTSSVQAKFETLCIETHVVESMDSDVRETVARICRENSALAARLTAKISRCEHECELGRSALRWAVAQGFDECRIGWTRTTGYKDVLVVVDPDITGRRLWTQDVPFSLSPVTLPEGRHLCKWGMIGGPSAVIDSNGSEVNFFLVDWVEE